MSRRTTAAGLLLSLGLGLSAATGALAPAWAATTDPGVDQTEVTEPTTDDLDPATPDETTETTSKPAASAFISTSASGLQLNGKPFRFIGFNNYQLTSTSANTCGRVLSSTQIDNVLNQAKSAGATVVRTWFFQQSFVKNKYAAFDRVLNKAHDRGLRVVPTLVNHFKDCEPSKGLVKSRAWYQSGYKSANQYGYTQSFKDYAYNLAAHYRNNTTIAYWNIINEPRVSPDGSCQSGDATILRSFVDDMGGAIHGADPNHLVSLGTEGTGHCGSSTSAEYQKVHQSGGTDLCEYHDYDRANQSDPRSGTASALSARINDCAAVGKVLVVGESGVVADAQTDGGSSGTISSTTLQRRANFFSAKLDGAFGSGVVGYLLWEKIPDGSGSTYNLDHGRYGIGPNDPLNNVTKAKAASLN